MDPRAYTPDELRVLRRHYPEHGAERVQDLLPHRSVESIRARAAKLGLRRQWGPNKTQRTQAKWTRREEQRLVELWLRDADHIDNIARKIGGRHTVEACRTKLRDLGVNRQASVRSKEGRCVCCGLRFPRSHIGGVCCDGDICREVEDVIFRRKKILGPRGSGLKKFQALCGQSWPMAVSFILIALLHEGIRDAQRR